MVPRSVRWRPVEGAGLEHLELRETEHGIVARSALIGKFEGFDFAMSYEIRLMRDWTFRSLELTRTDGSTLTIESDGVGDWTINGRPEPQFYDCVDIDIAATPFTNTLPIRRARFELGVPQHFRMVWLPPDTLDPFVEEQVYTQLGPDRFRYRAADGSFEADLSVDADGLVVDYPGLFRRA